MQALFQLSYGPKQIVENDRGYPFVNPFSCRKGGKGLHLRRAHRML